MSDAEKSNAESTASASTAGPSFIRRNRFPKAQPNIAVSSGMARIRRLSGHYSSTGQQPAATPPHPATAMETANQDVGANLAINNNVDRTPPLTPLPQQQFNIQQTNASFLTKQLSDSSKLESKETKSPSKPSTPLQHHHSIHDENLNSPSPLATSVASTSLNSHQQLHLSHAGLSGSSVTARHYINLQNQLASYTHSSSSNHPSPLTNDHYLSKSVHLVAIPPSPAQPRTPTLFPITPCGSVYNPKFSSEHIMNIIKYKSLQKLKKIETETLKEKRKSYKKELLSSIAAATSVIENEDSNSTSLSNDSKEKATLGGLTTLNIDKSKLRMKDFLYYNPKVAKKADPNEIIIETIVDNQTATETTSVVNENENSVAESLASTSSSSFTSNETNSASKKDSQTTSTSTTSSSQMAAPQLKFAEDGSIIINEESLLIQREHVEPVYDSTVVESEQNDNLTYNSYRKFHHTKKWTERETAKFYKALSMIGTDFTMIQRLFSHRSRDEIKRKFKREEKLNQAFIDKVLSKTSQIDLSVFVSSGSEDDKQTSEKAEKNVKKQAKNKSETTETVQNQEADTEDSSSSKKKKTKLKRIKKREFIESESDSENVTGTASDKQSAKKNNTKKKIDPLSSSISGNKKETSQLKKPNKSKEFISSDNDTNERLVANQTQSVQEAIIAQSDAHCSQSISIEQLETQLVVSSNTSINLNSQSNKENKQDVLDEMKLVVDQPRVDEKGAEDDDEDDDDEEDGIELVFDMETNNIHEINSSRNETVIVDNQIVNTNLVNNQFDMLTMPNVEPMCNTININQVEMSQEQDKERIDGDENDDEDVIFDLDNNTYIKNNEVIRISDQEIRATSLGNQQEANDESSVNQAKSSSSIIITKILKE